MVWMCAGLGLGLCVMLFWRAVTPLAARPCSWLAFDSQTRAMSSSTMNDAWLSLVMPTVFRMAFSAWPIFASLDGSIGDWPCLAVMMIVVDASSPLSFSSSTIDLMAVSTDVIAPLSCGVKIG